MNINRQLLEQFQQSEKGKVAKIIEVPLIPVETAKSTQLAATIDIEKISEKDVKIGNIITRDVVGSHQRIDDNQNNEDIVVDVEHIRKTVTIQAGSSSFR